MEAEKVSKLVEEHLANILQMLDVEGSIQVDPIEVEDHKYIDVRVTVPEKDSGMLIGHAGSRLKSLTVVLNMMLPRDENRYSVILDINGYRDQRAVYIRDIANRAIEEAVSMMEEIELEPMSSWERRIVHMQVSERTDVTTESIGEGEDRRVIIRPVSVV